MLQARTIKHEHSDIFRFLHGDLEATAAFCRRPEDTCSRSLVYASEAEQLRQALRLKAAILIIHDKLVDQAAPFAASAGCLFSVSAVPMAMATLLKYFDKKCERFTQWGARHPTALVHDRASLGQNVVLGPYCVIGADAAIGDDCVIGSHTVVESHARIGARTILHPHVFVGSACEIGRDCEIHPHTSIGSDGFGYAVDARGKAQKIPQLGNVNIGDHVEIGSNCAIDRATIKSTYIRSGTKLDNICHIAHNCDLGEDGLYTAGFMMAGSTTIGRRFVTGGNSVVSAHLTLADDVMLAGRSTVTKDITESGAYGGHPLQPLKDALKTIVNIAQVSAMRKDLRKVMQHLQLRGKD